jgi:hypothetical protein
MTSERLEYRLWWKRCGRNATSKIMQTEKGAVEKAERLLRLDEDKRVVDVDTGRSPFEGMPDLEWLRLERRPVGAWERAREFDVPEPDPDYQPEESHAGIEVPWGPDDVGVQW